MFFLSPVVPSSKESHGSEALFGPDVDYFGDFYRTGSKSKKQQEEPLGSVCKTSSESVLRLIHCWRLFVIIISFKLRSWAWQLEWNVIVSFVCYRHLTNKRPFLVLPTACPVAGGYCTAVLPCADGFYYCDQVYPCLDPHFPTCCCPIPVNRYDFTYQSNNDMIVKPTLKLPERKYGNYYNRKITAQKVRWVEKKTSATSDFQPLKTILFFINNRGFTERYFSDKVHAILIEEVPVQTTLRDGASLEYLHQPSNFVLNIFTLTYNV